MISNIIDFIFYYIPELLYIFSIYALLCLEIYTLKNKWKLKIITITIINILIFLIKFYYSKFMGDIAIVIVQTIYLCLIIYYFIIFLYRKYKQINIKQ